MLQAPAFDSPCHSTLRHYLLRRAQQCALQQAKPEVVQGSNAPTLGECAPMGKCYGTPALDEAVAVQLTSARGLKQPSDGTEMAMEGQVHGRARTRHSTEQSSSTSRRKTCNEGRSTPSKASKPTSAVHLHPVETTSSSRSNGNHIQRDELPGAQAVLRRTLTQRTGEGDIGMASRPWRPHRPLHSLWVPCFPLTETCST